MEELKRRRSHIYDGLVGILKSAEPDSPRATTKDILDFLVSWGVVIQMGEPSLVDDRDYFAIEPLIEENK